MGEAARRRDRIQQIAKQRGYSTAPATIVVDGENYDTTTGARVDGPKRQQAPKRGKRMGWKPRTIKIGWRRAERHFELDRHANGQLQVYEIVDLQRRAVRDIATLQLVQVEIDWDVAIKYDAVFDRLRELQPVANVSP